MPANYNLPRASNLWTVDDVELYQKLPYYLATLEAKLFPVFTVWDKLFGSRPWQKNMGDIMRAVSAEPSPIQTNMFFPNNITEQPKKDVFSIRERTDEARVKRHLYESPYFSFLPSFRDFRKNQIGFASKDIVQQIAVRHEQFIRSTVFHRSPFVFISGKATSAANDGFDSTGELVAAPMGDGNDAGTTAKSTAWLQAAINYIGGGGGNSDLGALSYNTIRKAKTVLCEDIQAPAWEGMGNKSVDNKTIAGKWLLITSNEAFEALSFDNTILANRPQLMNLLNDEFSGIIGSHIACRIERFPIRVAADGTIPGPQTYEANPAAYNVGETVPNPAYNAAPYEIAFMMGAQPYESITVGAPPKEFASGSMGAEKFNALEWNGQVKLTDNVLVNYGGGNLDTNKHGEFVQLISSTVHGILPINRRYVIPILFRRRRVLAN
jgi:hypothetical protein